MNQIVIIAGGLATRLHPITKKIPKSMIQINGIPFFEHQIDLCKKNGIKEIVLCAGHLWQQIQDYFRNGEEFGISIKYSIENEKLDTGGAIKNAYNLLGNDFFVLYGDSYLDIDWAKAYKKFQSTDCLGLMTILENNNHLAPSQLLVDSSENWVTYFTKKDFSPEMRHMEFGLNIMKKSIINQIQRKSFPIGEYFDLMIDQGKLATFITKKRFYEVGSIEGIKTLEKYLTTK